MLAASITLVCAALALAPLEAMPVWGRLVAGAVVGLAIVVGGGAFPLRFGATLDAEGST